MNRLRRGSGHRSAQAVPRSLDVRSGGHATALWRGLASAQGRGQVTHGVRQVALMCSRCNTEKATKAWSRQGRQTLGNAIQRRTSTVISNDRLAPLTDQATEFTAKSTRVESERNIHGRSNPSHTWLAACMGFVWVHADSFLHPVASPFHSIATTLPTPVPGAARMHAFGANPRSATRNGLLPVNDCTLLYLDKNHVSASTGTGQPLMHVAAPRMSIARASWCISPCQYPGRVGFRVKFAIGV